MSQYDYKEADLIRVFPESIIGGLGTLVKLCQLFDISYDMEPWPGPIVLCIHKLNTQDRQVVLDLLEENKK